MKVRSNRRLDSESAQVRVSTSSNLLVICCSVTVRRAQIRSAQR